MTPSTLVARTRRWAWKREARQRGRAKVEDDRTPSSILGKRDGERDSQYEDVAFTHVDKRTRDIEATDMELGSPNALSAETAKEQFRRAQ